MFAASFRPALFRLGISVSFAAGSLLLAAVCVESTRAQEHKVEKLDSAAPADELSPEIAPLLAPTGFKLVRGESRTICEIWLCKEWPVDNKVEAAGAVIYPLNPGQLVGVIRYPRRAADFRDQTIPSGVYTLRYGHQPVDGAHVGTSPTRDFLVVSPAEKDRDPALLDYKALVAVGKETSGSAHPAILSLQRPAAEGDLTVREDADHEWTVVRFTGQFKQGETTKPLAVEAVLVGVAAE
ncbi:MAG: hypothetical protein MUF06_12180 [Pirellulaceae bacterium]|jgi:hypothetical protein|nr:hypothetical protein [Pirellulaceae bacterium]